MNKVFLIGNLTRDPELSETNGGTPFCRFSLAVNRPYQEDGNRGADYFNIIAWRGQAETCSKYLAKGRKVAIVGALQNRTYEDRDGNKRTVTEVVANEVEFLSPTNSPSENENDSERQISASQLTLTPVEDDDDLPFREVKL